MKKSKEKWIDGLILIYDSKGRVGKDKTVYILASQRNENTKRV